jgi:hypothetical protein
MYSSPTCVGFVLGSSGWGSRSYVLATCYASGGKCVGVGAERHGALFCNRLPQRFTMSGPHYISASNRRATRHAATEYLSPDDVGSFRTAILDAGYRLGTLLTAEYPRADLVSDVLYAVTTVVGVYGLEGKWVTSWASGARSEFLATTEVREVRASVFLLSIRASRCVFLTLFVLFRPRCRR